MGEMIEVEGSREAFSRPGCSLCSKLPVRVTSGLRNRIKRRQRRKAHVKEKALRSLLKKGARNSQDAVRENTMIS
jgi:hypothetical protein